MLYMAFLLGVMGSLHCVGMCGPIALALPVHHLSSFRKILAIISYNLSRVTTYAILGCAVGGLGQSIAIGKWQQPLSIALGAFLIGTVIYSTHWFESLRIPFQYQQFLHRIKTLLQRPVKQQGIASMFALGFLNGLIPCGMIYVALLAAIATGNAIEGGIYMAAYGFGTFPAMLATGWLGQWASLQVRQYFRKALPYVVAFTGIWLIMRGVLVHNHTPETDSNQIPICSNK